MNVATDESLETLAVSELQVKHAAMGIHEREGVEFALVAVFERAKVSPIDLLRPIFRWLKEVLTVPATPFAHAGVVALRRGDQVFDLETVIECVPRPRQMVKFHNVNAGGNAVVLFRRRH